MIHLQIETCKLQIDSQSVYIMVLTYISSSLKLKREMRHNRTFDNNRSSLIHSNYSSLGNFLSQFALRTTSNRGEKSAFTITKRRSVNLARSSIIDSIPVSKCRARASILTLQFPQGIETAVVVALIPIIGTSYKKRTNPASNAVRLA